MAAGRTQSPHQEFEDPEEARLGELLQAALIRVSLRERELPPEAPLAVTPGGLPDPFPSFFTVP